MLIKIKNYKNNIISSFLMISSFKILKNVYQLLINQKEKRLLLLFRLI